MGYNIFDFCLLNIYYNNLLKKLLSQIKNKNFRGSPFCGVEGDVNIIAAQTPIDIKTISF